MNSILTLFAHAAEFHTEETTTAEHILTNAWVLLALYAAALAGIWFGFARSERLKTYRLLGVVIVSLPIAFISYAFAPPLAVSAIVIGFAASLLLMLVTASPK